MTMFSSGWLREQRRPRGQVQQLGALAAVAFAIPVIPLSMAVALGGETVTNRVGRLFEASAGEVYYQNRGNFLEHTINHLLPKYRLGAGLGRWGVMNGYFGSSSDAEKAPIYVEIQWTGWLLDGGIPLILAYVTSPLLVLKTNLGLAFHTSPQVATWAAVLTAYNVGAIALMFNYPTSSARVAWSSGF